MCYAVLAAVLVALATVAIVRFRRGRESDLPLVTEPPEISGQSCPDALVTARALAQRGTLDRSRAAYLWMVGHCEGTPVLSEAVLEVGGLLGYRLHQPREALKIYRNFLRRFPTSPEAPDALYHLAKLELDAGQYTAAVAHLTALADQYPDSPHEESARFLARRAAEALASEKHTRRTVRGQLAELVPNNVLSFFVLLAALGPSALQAISRARTEGGGRRRWVIPGIIIALTMLNYTINNIDSASKNRELMDKLDKILAASAQAQGTR